MLVSEDGKHMPCFRITKPNFLALTLSVSSSHLPFALTDGLLLSQSRQRIVCLNCLKANVQVC